MTERVASTVIVGRMVHHEGVSRNESDVANPAAAEGRAVLLGPRASYQCARAIHNDFDPAIPLPQEPARVSADAKVLSGKAADFRQRVHDALLELFPAECLLDLSSIGAETAMIATKSAMSRRVPLIYRGVLPPDLAGARSGRPDILALDPSASDHDPRYLPILVKGHHSLETRRKARSSSSLRYCPLDRLVPLELSETVGSWRKNAKDALELAHFRRTLESCGFASAAAIGGLIGTEPIENQLAAVFIDLDTPLFPDARTGTQISALEYYDAKFQFRREVAEHARAHDPADPKFLPLAVASGGAECESCRWEPTCREAVGTRDASFVLGKLDFDEWNALRELGCHTVDDLAQLDIPTLRTWTPDTTEDNETVHLLRSYLAGVAHVTHAQANLAKAATRAQMFVKGQRIRRISNEPIEVPRASIEVDLDMESNQDGVYLWGMLISRPGGAPEYQAIARWTPPNPTTEAELAAELWGRLVELARQAADTGGEFLVYHYTSIEVAKLRQAVSAVADSRLPSLSELNTFIAKHFIDLHAIVKRNFVGFDGLGLKQVATTAGFQWRFDGAGGLQSTDWLSEFFRSGNAELRTRILEYNEDDVRATHAVRERINQIAD